MEIKLNADEIFKERKQKAKANLDRFNDGERSRILAHQQTVMMMAGYREPEKPCRMCLWFRYVSQDYTNHVGQPMCCRIPIRAGLMPKTAFKHLVISYDKPRDSGEERLPVMPFATCKHWEAEGDDD